MKTIEEYMKMPFKMELTPDTDEGGFVVSFPELPGCLSVGETLDEAYKNSIEAKRSWLEAAIDDGIFINEPNCASEYSGQFKLRIPKSLHKCLYEQSKQEGVSMNQYCVYLLSKGLNIKY